MKKFIIVSKCLTLFVFFIIIFGNVYIILEQLVLRNIAPKFFGYSFVVQNSNSLEPTINSGDLIVMKSSNGYSEGDIITYIKGNNNLVTAKITKIDDTIVTVCNLNSNKIEITTTGYIIGKVINNIPNLGNIITFLRSPLGIILLLVFIFILFELPYTIFKIFKRIKLKTIKVKVFS